MAVIISYNVNGVRAALKKGFIEWINACKPDILCLQETKALKEQVDTDQFEEAGYHHYWHSAEKKGYSGVAILCKEEPDHVEYGCKIGDNDREGRVLRVDFGDTSIISVYMPSGSSGDLRQAFKMEWLADFEAYIKELRRERPKLIISGDYNICHKPIDIHNPISNKNSSGFLPEERDWIDGFMKTGMVDSFRHFNQDPHHYSWWTYRQQARERNLGWRIDYNLVSQPLAGSMKAARILSEAKHSDHCPVYLEIDY
ncbi:MAG: exodeoxyribonuclease III [Flavobacteriales bacterium]|nr:exodeoxyribonuclease III [Flavobacteriales bacterium]